MPALADDVTAQHPIVLFDGVCNLCAKSVQFVIRNDRAGVFRFASLQSVTAQKILRATHHEHTALTSVLLLVDGRLYRKSEAALQICRRLDRAWPALYYLFAWVPVRLADKVYDYIGARRYRWFGKKDACWIPSAELATRFVDVQGDASTRIDAA
jgi:predicted DCC family thiol-disulfide oxidoreductase YuxK